MPTTLWVTSLDGAPVAQSSRLLLVHLTDVQGDGREYADDTRTLLLKWGKGCLAEVGAAEVELRLMAEAARSDIGGGRGEDSPRPFPAEWRVWALDTTGRRVAELPCNLAVSGEAQNTLRFSVSTRGAEGGRIFYEIVR